MKPQRFRGGKHGASPRTEVRRIFITNSGTIAIYLHAPPNTSSPISSASSLATASSTPNKVSKPRTPSHPLRHIRAFNGVRALAILAIVLYHTRPSLLPGGFVGVTVFFVLSGYLITASALNEKSTSGHFSYAAYLRRRFIRLWPPVICTIALSALLTYLFSPSLLPKVQGDALPSVLFSSNWVYIFRNVSYFDAAGLPSPLTHLWYVAVLAQFYILWPIIMWAVIRLGKSRRTTLQIVGTLALISALAMLIIFVVTKDTGRAYYGLDTRAAELLIGAAAAIYKPTSASGLKVAGIAGAAVVLIATIWADGESAVMYCGGYTLVALASASCIAALYSARDVTAKALSSAPFTYLGSRSFSIYLIHYPLLLIMNPATRTTDPRWWEHILQLVAVLAASEAFYQLIEKPTQYFLRSGFLRASTKEPVSAHKKSTQHKVPTIAHVALLACSLLAVATLAFAPVNWKIFPMPAQSPYAQS